MEVDIIIVGAGCAGLTAAEYASRAGKNVLVLEKESFGGQIAFSPKVENYPSIKQISGSEFADNLLSQALDFGARVELENVERIEKKGDRFVVTTDYATHTAKSVIIASGVKHRKLGVDGEEELIGKGVSYCAVCDGAFYKGEEVALIGDANTALQYAMLLASYCKKVYVCTLFDKFFGEKVLVDALKARENVEIYHNLSLKKYLSENGALCGLEFENTQNGELFALKVPAVFIAIGQIPDNAVFADIVKLDKNGYIIAGEDCKTGCAGLFVAGDCRTKATRQLVTASADGAVCAISACNYIDTMP